MTQTRKSLGWWQWETLLVTMGGYALYYIIRKNFSLAMPLLKDLGLNTEQLGVFLTVGGILYGIARFTNGILTDRNSARKVMSIGLFICACVNLAFGCSDWMAKGISSASGGALAFTTTLVWVMGVIWVVHGYFQGMGVGQIGRAHV